MCTCLHDMIYIDTVYMNTYTSIGLYIYACYRIYIYLMYAYISVHVCDYTYWRYI